MYKLKVSSNIILKIKFVNANSFQDSIDFKKEESLIPKQLPNFNWPENFDYKHIESVPVSLEEVFLCVLS